MLAVHRTRNCPAHTAARPSQRAAAPGLVLAVLAGHNTHPMLPCAPLPTYAAALGPPLAFLGRERDDPDWQTEPFGTDEDRAGALVRSAEAGFGCCTSFENDTAAAEGTKDQAPAEADMAAEGAADMSVVAEARKDRLEAGSSLLEAGPAAPRIASWREGSWHSYAQARL